MKINLKKILWLMIIVSVAVVCSAFSASAALAQTGSCGEKVTWSYNSTTKALVISGEGEMKDCTNPSDSPFYLSDIEEVVISEGVTSVGACAFYNCYSLKSVTISDGVTGIGSSAFSFCYNLSDVTLGSGIKTIGESAFSVCDSLTEIAIPDTTETIGDSAFYECGKLGCVSIGNGVTAIGDSAFYNCKALSDIIIPDSVTVIGSSAFSGCEKLKNLTLGKGLTDIGNCAFNYCFGIENVYASELKSWLGIDFGQDYSNPMSLADSFYFDGVPAKDIIIPDGVIAIGDFAFYGSNITSVTIPDSVESIGNYSFYGCYGLESAVIGEGVTRIGDYAFSECQKLSDVRLGQGLTEIGDAAFYDCEMLTEIIIPDNVTLIGDNVFQDAFRVCIYCSKSSAAAEYAESREINHVYRDGTDEESIVAGSIKNYTWTLDIRTGVLEIDGSGVMPDFSFNDSPWYSYSYCVKQLNLPEGITKIGRNSFRNLYRLDTIIIPDSVIHIGDYAFYGCIGLKSLKTGKNIRYVGEAAFHWEGDNGAQPFVIESLYLPETDFLFAIEFAYDSDGSSPYNFLSGARNVFVDGERITQIIVPDGVTRINDYLFAKCNWLESVKISDSTVSIGERAFYCSNLSDIEIGDGVASIDNLAFGDCDSLREIIIPSGVSYIDCWAFNSCDNLESITFALSEENLSSIASLPGLAQTKVKDIVLPASVNLIDEGVIPENLETITVCNPDCEFFYLCGLGYGHTIIGFKGSTAELFADMVGAEFVDIETVHNHEYKNISAEDCCFFGRCSCGKENKRLHTYFSEVTVEPACTAEGTKTFTCSCGDSYTEVLKATGHTAVIDEAISATCTSAGLTAGSHCSVCKETIVAQSEIPAEGHSFGQWYIYRKANCETEGEKRRDCSECSFTEFEVIPVTGEHEWQVKEFLAPTCASEGFKYSICSVCKERRVERISATNSHTERNYVIKATDDEDGKIITVCSCCGKETAEKTISLIASVSLSAKKFSYNGKVIWPSVTVKDSKGKTLVLNKDYTVSYPPGRKSIGKYVITVKFKGNYSGKEKLCFSILPQTPSSLRASSVSESSVKVSWKAVPGATGYRVYRYNSSLGKYQSIAFVEGKTSLTVPSLKSGTEYKFRIRAYTETDEDTVLWSGYSEVLSAVTKPAPTILKKLSAGKSQLTVTWKAVSGVTGYEIEYSTSADLGKKTTKKTVVKKAKASKMTLKKLKKGKKYFVRIRTFRTVGKATVYSAYSAVKSVKVK